MRRFVLFSVVVASLVLLPNSMGVAQDGENVLLHEDFEGKEKKDTWEVLESDVGNGYGVTKGFLNAFGALNWQFRMPFTKILIAVFLLASVVGLSEAQIVRDGLVSYWSFNDDSIKGDKVNDLWGDNHGTLFNDPEEVEGKYGEALEFTGDNHIDIPDSDSLNLSTGEVSVTAWVLRTGPGETERGGIVEKGTGGTDNTPLLLREWTAGTVDFEVWSLEATPERNWAKLQSDSIALVDDVWVFLAGTYDGADQKIYVNSKLDGTLANPGGYTNNDLMLRIGWDPHAEDRHYVGVIDEVAIYDRALTPNEIVQNQNASLGITSVDPAGKLSSTWGEIKAGY